MKSSAIHRTAIIAAVCSTALTAAACGQMDGKPKNNPLENVIGSKASDATTVEKFNDYTKAFNALIDDNWGVSKYYNRYQELNLPSKGVDATINFPENISHLERAIATLKEGRALPSNAKTADADAAADKTIAAAEVVLAQWKELSPYYDSRGYREDNLAKGKAAHEQLITAYRNAVTAIDSLDAALTANQRQRNAEHAEALIKAGHTDQAVAVETMQIADFFTTAALEENETEADRLLVQLEASVAKLRAAADKLPADDSNKRYYNSIVDRLTSAIGNWRDYKQTKRTSNLESLLSQYNRAIGYFDDVEFSA